MIIDMKVATNLPIPDQVCLLLRCSYPKESITLSIDDLGDYSTGRTAAYLNSPSVFRHWQLPFSHTHYQGLRGVWHLSVCVCFSA